MSLVTPNRKEHRNMTVIQPMKMWCACGNEATFFAQSDKDGLLLWCDECVPDNEEAT